MGHDRDLVHPEERNCQILKSKKEIRTGFGLTWTALALLQDVFECRLEEAVAHLVSVSV